MATQKIPLNLYKRITKNLQRRPEVVYEGQLDRASTFVTALVTNTTDKNRTVTLQVSSLKENNLLELEPETTTLIADVPFVPREYDNLLPAKLVITEGDSFIASADIEDLASINDEGLFWLYDLPVQLTDTNLQVGFTTNTEITANFITGGIRNRQRSFNADFNEWTGWVESFPGSNTTIEYPVSGASPINVANITGPDGYVMGMGLYSGSGVTPKPTGTVSIKKQTSTPEERELFNNIFYPRVNLTNIDPRANEILDPTTTVLISTVQWGGAGVLLRNTANDPISNVTTNPIVTNVGRDLFGKTIKVVAWMRASEDTKAVIEAPATGADAPEGPGRYNYGVVNNYTIFNLTTAWTRYETLFTFPTLDEYWLSAWFFLQGSNSPSSVQRQALIQLSGGYTSFTYPFADPALKTTIPLSSYSFGLTVRMHYSIQNSYVRRVGDSVASFNHIISTVNSSTILNGYYDIAGLEVFVETGTDFVPLTSFDPVSFTYDLSNDTDTNLTLSILEAVNIP